MASAEGLGGDHLALTDSHRQTKTKFCDEVERQPPPPPTTRCFLLLIVFVFSTVSPAAEGKITSGYQCI